MNLTVFNGCLIVSLIAFCLFLILYSDRILWVLSQTPNFLRNFFMAINKAWFFAVKGININCSSVGTKKLMDKKTAKYYKEKKAIEKIKKRKDTIDEDAIKLAEMRAVKKNDSIDQPDTANNLKLLCSKKIFTNETFYDNLQGGDWTLVRRSYGKWHLSNDGCYKNTSSDSVYGKFKNSDVIKSSFSREIPLKEYTQFLFSNDEIGKDGLPTKWIIINKDDLHNIVGNNIQVVSSSINKNRHEIAIDKTSSLAINIKGWGNDNSDLTIYMENSSDGSNAGRNYKNVNNKGVNVFVRNYINFTQIGNPVATSSRYLWSGSGEKAIDGNAEPRYRFNSVTHTAKDRFAWWEVDLNQDYSISKIEIFNRWENDKTRDYNRLHNFDVKIDGTVVKAFGRGIHKVYTVNINPPKKGRRVKIQFNGKNPNYLSLAEVKVWGVNTDKNNNFENFIVRKGNNDTINKSEIYDKRRVIEGFNNSNGVFYINPKSDNPLEKTGYVNKEQAILACNQYNAKLATKDQMVDAYTNKKINWCSYGWLDNKDGEVCLPLQPDFLTDKQISQGLCGSNSSGAGIKCINRLKNEPYGAICYG